MLISRTLNWPRFTVVVPRPLAACTFTVPALAAVKLNVPLRVLPAVIVTTPAVVLVAPLPPVRFRPSVPLWRSKGAAELSEPVPLIVPPSRCTRGMEAGTFTWSVPPETVAVPLPRLPASVKMPPETVRGPLPTVPVSDIAPPETVTAPLPMAPLTLIKPPETVMGVLPSAPLTTRLPLLTFVAPV